MKLEKFKEKNQKKRFMIIFTVCCVILLAGVFLYTSFAVFTEEKEFNIINGMYQDPGDLYFAVYVDGEITNIFPKKEDGYSFDASQSSCTNGATVSWDNESWGAAINFTNYQATNMSRTKCTMYFKKDSTAVDFIKDLADNTNDLVYDETSDNNLRYIGANPNNYVSFNGELWRIIGVMNNIDNGSGTKETRLKIIRNESIGSYRWEYETSNWNISEIEKELNDTYVNTITSLYQEMIDTVLWNLGGISNTSNTPAVFYTQERLSTVFGDNPSTWTGKVGLVYPSDYGFATSGDSTINRTECLSYPLDNWSNYANCYNNDWLYAGSQYWTMSTMSSMHAYYVNTYNGNIESRYVDASFDVKPTLYLLPSVKITEGTGTSSDPYTLSL